MGGCNSVILHIVVLWFKLLRFWRLPLTCVIRLGWNKIVESEMESFHVLMRQCTALYVLALHQIRHVQPCKPFLLLLFFFLSKTRKFIFPIFQSRYFVFEAGLSGRVAQKHQQTVSWTAGMLDRIISVRFAIKLRLPLNFVFAPP